MYQESIQDFLSIPGVLGVALICQRAQLYLHLKEQTLDWNKKQFLTQSVPQIIAKIPEKVDFFEFRIGENYGYTYKLNFDFTLLVLTLTDIATIRLRPLAAKQLKATLQKDIDITVATFKLLTENPSQPSAVSMTVTTGLDKLSNYDNKLLENQVTVEHLLNALNRLSQFSSDYIGKNLAANYWQSTRPGFDWLDNFSLNRSAEITFSGVIKEPVSALQHQWVKEWSAAFIKKCAQIIQDLPLMIEQKGLDEQNKKLLLTVPVAQPQKPRSGSISVSQGQKIRDVTVV